MLPVIAAIVVVLVLAGVVLAWMLWKKKKEGSFGETNYRAFFIMGLSFTPAGAAMSVIYFLNDIPFVIGLPLFALGVIYLSIGLANRDKWQKNGN
jgi:hypothetical protein